MGEPRSPCWFLVLVVANLVSYSFDIFSVCFVLFCLCVMCACRRAKESRANRQILYLLGLHVYQSTFSAYDLLYIACQIFCTNINWPKMWYCCCCSMGLSEYGGGGGRVEHTRTFFVCSGIFHEFCSCRGEQMCTMAGYICKSSLC